MLSELQNALVVNQKVQVTVWDPNNDSVELSFQSFVQEVGGSLFRLASPTTEAPVIMPLLQTGIVIGVVVETYPNPYIFYPLIHAAPESAQSGFWVKIPENPQVEVMQRRRHVRIPMIIPFQMEYLIGGRWIGMQARTEDVSGGGMRFSSLRLFPKGQDLVMTIPFSASAPPLRLKAKVVFSVQNRIKRQPDDLYSTACQFSDLSDADEMILVRECFKRELKIKEK